MLLVLVRELHVGDVRSQDAHPVALELAVEVILHVAHVGAAQVVGLLCLYLAAAAPYGVLNPAREDHVEVRRPDGPHECHGVGDAELQEKLDGL